MRERNMKDKNDKINKNLVKIEEGLIYLNMAKNKGRSICLLKTDIN